MALDERTPVIVGVAQSLRRPQGSVAGLAHPGAMIADVLRLAADDSGAGHALLDAAQSLRIVESFSWRVPDPAAIVANELGIDPAERLVTTTGGNSPQMVLNDAASAIQRGELDVVLVGGVEAMYTRRVARQAGEPVDWPQQDATAAPTRTLGVNRPGNNEIELARGLTMPTAVYPLFEIALRAAAGEGVDEHHRKISRLWARFSSVAARNPYAWSPVERTGEEIGTASPDNRMIAFPYPKLMNANMQVDQAAALILCSVAAARRAGISEDSWVFPLAGADAADHWFVSNRDTLHSSPAIRACGESVFSLAGMSRDDVAYIDLYSCFPSAVQMGADALGLPLLGDRDLTVTGGLGFAGGPGNNYVTHSIATIVDRLRNEPGSVGLVTALGWYATKHSIGLYSTNPPTGGFRAESPQERVDNQPGRDVVAEYDGDAVVESYTVLYDRDGAPQSAIVALLTPDGPRTWANSTDTALLDALTNDDLVGRKAQVAGGSVTVH